MANFHTVKVPIERKQRPTEAIYYCDLPVALYKRVRELLLGVMAFMPEVMKVLQETNPIAFCVLEHCFGFGTTRKNLKTIRVFLQKNQNFDISTEHIEMLVGETLYCLGASLPFSEVTQKRGATIRTAKYSFPYNENTPCLFGRTCFVFLQNLDRKEKGWYYKKGTLKILS